MNTLIIWPIVNFIAGLLMMADLTSRADRSADTDTDTNRRRRDNLIEGALLVIATAIQLVIIVKPVEGLATHSFLVKVSVVAGVLGFVLNRVLQHFSPADDIKPPSEH
jgi:hypothetical protein